MKRFALLAATILALGAATPSPSPSKAVGVQADEPTIVPLCDSAACSQVLNIDIRNDGENIILQNGLPNPHLLTYVELDSGKLNITPQQAAPYLTFIGPGSGASAARSFALAGINVIPYTDINHKVVNDTSGTNPYIPMAAIAVTCDGQYVQWTKHPGETIYLTDPRSPHTIQAWESWWSGFIAAGGQAWSVFEDTSDNPFTFASPAPPCNAAHTGPVTQAEWTAATEVQEAAMMAFTLKGIIFNGLSTGYHKQFPPQDALLDGPAWGGLAEACAPQNTGMWLNQLLIEIHTVRAQKYYICHGEDFTTNGGSPQGIAWRQWQFATMMLDYDPSRTVYFSTLAVGKSNLRVQPESGVVPEQPYKVNVITPADLLKGTGVYGRSYASCYVNGTLVGRCGVLVNSNATVAVYPWAKMHYKHTLAMNGSGVLDGGTVSASGAAPTATMPAYSGEIVFP